MSNNSRMILFIISPLCLTTICPTLVLGGSSAEAASADAYQDKAAPLTRGQILQALSAVDLEDPESASLMARLQVSGTNAVPVIREVLRDSQDPYIVTRALRLLPALGARDVQTLDLVRRLPGRLPDVENNVIATLGDIGDSSDTTQFLHALQSDNWRTRTEASKALAKRGDKAAVMKLDEALRKTCQDMSLDDIQKDSSLVIGFQSLKQMKIRLLDEQINESENEIEKQQILLQKRAILGQSEIPNDILQRHP